MSASGITARADLAVKAIWRLPLAEARHLMFRNSMTRLPGGLSRSGMAACMTNVVFCLSLWTSLVAAIWLSKGWIGLFFSGQVLSAGAGLFEILAKRTQYAFSSNNGPTHEFEGMRNE